MGKSNNITKKEKKGKRRTRMLKKEAENDPGHGRLMVVWRHLLWK